MNNSQSARAAPRSGAVHGSGTSSKLAKFAACAAFNLAISA
jgi:hypothetical protein